MAAELWTIWHRKTSTFGAEAVEYARKFFDSTLAQVPREAWDFELVATVEARHEEEAWQLTQHIHAAWTDNAEVKEVFKQGVRSTSVGDVVTNERGEMFVCAAMGFEKIN
jgi:hypothetical protein